MLEARCPESGRSDRWLVTCSTHPLLIGGGESSSRTQSSKGAPRLQRLPALGRDLSGALCGFEPCVFEFLLVYDEAAEFSVQHGQTSVVRTGRSHLLVEFVDALLRPLELAFEPCELLLRLTGLGSYRCAAGA